jgi:hypothetical protein
VKKDTDKANLKEISNADKKPAPNPGKRSPVHVVYGGANIFQANTPEKLGKLAIGSIEKYCPNFADFARAMWLKGAEDMPIDQTGIRELEFQFADDPAAARSNNPDAFLAWEVFQKTISKLQNNPIEDYRIDFEDGYGIRSDDEEDGHCISASDALSAFLAKTDSMTSTGFRIKSFQPETRSRAIRTLERFLTNLVQKTDGNLPADFVVTLPKIKSAAETGSLSKLLNKVESDLGLPEQGIGVEILIETPECIPIIREIVEALDGRCTSAHFGAYDYTSSLGITANHQHLRHEACGFARNMMQVSLAPLGLRLSDSVTVELPIPIHKGENLSISQMAENKQAVHNAWRKHFNNITNSQINGFYQSWDLHPAQLVARFAAVYSFFLDSHDEQAKRLRSFLNKATQAMTTGNLFDDLASAEGLLNFFRRGVQCGAFSNKDVIRSVALTEDEFHSDSFFQIMEGRFTKAAI